MIKTAKQQLSRNPSNAGYQNPLKTYSVPATENPDGTINVPVQPVYLVDPTVEPIAMTGNRIQITDPFGGGPVLQQPIGNAISTGGGSALQTVALQALSNVVSGAYESVRTPTIFRHALCTSVAATAVWDPAAGKKFRIMGYVIVPAAGMAAAGIQLITLLDQAAAIVIAHQVYLPIAASVVNQPPIVVQLPGNGYLSTAADNILNCTLTAACTAGAISIFVYGTEE